MLKGLSLSELAVKIKDIASQKKDFIVDTTNLPMVVDGNEPKLALTHEDGLYWHCPIKSLAHGQIATRLGIPQTYYDRLRAEAPQLLAENVNTWLRKTPEKRMVRTLDGEVRAYLSNRYQRIENEEIAEAALPVLFATPGISVVSCEVTDRRMYIQAVTNRVTADVKVGDAVQAGIVISNSEVGAGAVSIAAMTYRLVCLNGMINAEKFRAAHLGPQVDDNEALWADDTRKADDRTVLLKVRDMVTASLDEARFHARVAKMRDLTEARVEHIVPTVEVLGQKIGATQDETNSILNALITGGDLSAWGVVNAVTAQAHVAKSYDRAVEFETIGGQLLELSRDAWKEVLGAEKAPARRGRKALVVA